MIDYSTLRVGPLMIAALAVACGPDSASSSDGSYQSGGNGQDVSAVTGGQGSTSVGAGGGVSASGGAPLGGAPSGGASVGSGGTSSGGTSTDGAPTGTGGLSTGGAPTGTGGTSTGGTSTGGTSTGGTSTGGTLTGGTLTGGTSTGGTSTGGTSTGGTATQTGGSGPGTPSSGCSVTDVVTGAAIDGTITVGGQSRTYRLSVPTDYVAGEPLPLVFGLNGVGGDGKGAQSSFRIETDHRGIFVYPDSIYKESSGTVDWDYTSNGYDVAFFDALVAELTESYCVDMDRIFALGVSAGGIMSNMLGCFRGDVLRAIAPSSAMTWQNSCSGDVAVMVFCGEQDSFNPCNTDGQGEIDFWTAQSGCTAQSEPSPLADICEAYQGCSAENPVLLCTHSGGHMWPTDGSTIAWAFFMEL